MGGSDSTECRCISINAARSTSTRMTTEQPPPPASEDASAPFAARFGSAAEAVCAQGQVTLTVALPASIGGGLLPSFGGCISIGPEYDML